MAGSSPVSMVSPIQPFDRPRCRHHRRNGVGVRRGGSPVCNAGQNWFAALGFPLRACWGLSTVQTSRAEVGMRSDDGVEPFAGDLFLRLAEHGWLVVSPEQAERAI